MPQRKRWLSFTRILALLGLVVLVGGSAPTSASFCFRAINQTIYYYSDATLTHLVGSCVISNLCGGPSGCTGTQTSFTKLVQSVPCEVCH